jgi:hypothetical protein
MEIKAKKVKIKNKIKNKSSQKYRNLDLENLKSKKTKVTKYWRELPQIQKANQLKNNSNSQMNILVPKGIIYVTHKINQIQFFLSLLPSTINRTQPHHKC